MKERKLLLPFVFSAILISLFLISCVTTKPAKNAVATPEIINCARCKTLQQKYYNDLISLANLMPFNIKVNSMGFIDWKDSLYFSVEIVGDHYNTLKTTTIKRLTNEFHEKFQEIAKIILKESFINEVSGIHIVLICTSADFVNDKYGFNSKPNTLEIFTSTIVTNKFLNGEITSQEFINNSIVFVDAQRTQFILEMM